MQQWQYGITGSGISRTARGILLIYVFLHVNPNKTVANYYLLKHNGTATCATAQSTKKQDTTRNTANIKWQWNGGDCVLVLIQCVCL